MDNQAYGKLDYSLCLLSATAEGKRHGCIVNSFHQVSNAYPPRFTVTLSRDHETTKAVLSSGSFCVTLLAQDAPESIVDTFGYTSGRAADKFAAYSTETDDAGNPYLREHMVSRISCKVVDQLAIGSYILFVGQATEAEVFSQGQVLTLKAFTARGKTTPPTATVYRTMEGNGFRCTVCGYIYEAETVPQGYICPICRAPAEKFVRQE